MTPTPAFNRNLFLFALALLLIGALGPVVKGASAVSALIVGGVFAVLLLLVWVFCRAGKGWAARTATILAPVFLVAILGRAIPTWKAALGDAPEKTFAAGLMTAMALACAVFGVLLFKTAGRRSQA